MKLFCTMFLWIKQIDSKIAAHMTYYPGIQKIHLLRIQDIIIYTIWCLHINRITILRRLIYLNWLAKKESHVNIRMGTDYHQLIMPPISKDCSIIFLEHLFIYAAPCDWNKLSDHIRTSNFGCFRKSVETMLFIQQYEADWKQQCIYLFI